MEEARASGIEDILIVTGKGERAIKGHFDYSAELEWNLKKKGKLDLLEKFHYSINLADIHYIRQKEPKGLGHAVWCACACNTLKAIHINFSVIVKSDIHEFLNGFQGNFRTAKCVGMINLVLNSFPDNQCPRIPRGILTILVEFQSGFTVMTIIVSDRTLSPSLASTPNNKMEKCFFKKLLSSLFFIIFFKHNLLSLLF